MTKLQLRMLDRIAGELEALQHRVNASAEPANERQKTERALDYIKQAKTALICALREAA